ALRGQVPKRHRLKLGDAVTQKLLERPVRVGEPTVEVDRRKRQGGERNQADGHPRRGVPSPRALSRPRRLAGVSRLQAGQPAWHPRRGVDLGRGIHRANSLATKTVPARSFGQSPTALERPPRRSTPPTRY